MQTKFWQLSKNFFRYYCSQGKSTVDWLLRPSSKGTSINIGDDTADNQMSDWSSDKKSNVIHLTSNNFKQTIQENASVLVMFYAPWCHHCKTLKPAFEKASTILKNQNIKGLLAAVDGTQENSLVKESNVEGYPTLNYYLQGRYETEVTLRDTNEIVEFMKKKAPK